MPIIHFTPADALQTTVVEASYYPCEISSIEGPKKSGSGKSLNYFFDVTITDGPYKGKSKTIALTDGSDSASLLGTMDWMPQSAMLDIKEAITGITKMQLVNEPMDTDTLLHQPFVSKWVTATVEGKLVNSIVSFHPVGYDKGQPSF